MMKYILCMLFLLVSCSTRPAEPTGFLSDTYLLEDGEFLQRVWKDENFELKNYDSITIAPISTTFLKTMGWWDKMNPTNYTEQKPDSLGPGFKSNSNQKTASDMAKYFHQKIVKAFKNTPKNRFEVREYSKKDDKTLVLSIAISELVPIKKYMAGLGLIGDGSLKGGSIAIEGKIRAGLSNKVLVMFTDRRINNRPRKLNDSTRLSFYSHAKPIMDEWSDLFVKLANK